MLKKGDKVEIKASVYTGEIGVVIRQEKKAEPGEPQHTKWVVKMSRDTYTFDEDLLKKLDD